MTTVTIQIDNADNKLTQLEWTRFVAEVAEEVQGHGGNGAFLRRIAQLNDPAERGVGAGM